MAGSQDSEGERPQFVEVRSLVFSFFNYKESLDGYFSLCSHHQNFPHETASLLEVKYRA